MRGICFGAGSSSKVFTIAFLSSLLVSSLSFAGPTTFVESCLNDTGILQKQLVCEVRTSDQRSVLSFTLEQGQEMRVYASGQFGSFDKTLDVVKITHLPPRIADTGVMGESLEFAARGGVFGDVLATFTVPCHQSDFAAIGIDRVSGSNEPSQIVATCHVQ